MNWDRIDECRERCRVPFGWIYRESEWVTHDTCNGMIGGWDSRTCVCFVFDPFHWWKLEVKDA